MKIAIVTDAWHPQVNGVVRTLTKTQEGLEAIGHEVLMITPETFWTIPCPTYPEIRLSVFSGRVVSSKLRTLFRIGIFGGLEKVKIYPAWPNHRVANAP